MPPRNLTPVRPLRTLFHAPRRIWMGLGIRLAAGDLPPPDPPCRKRDQGDEGDDRAFEAYCRRHGIGRTGR